MSKDVVVSTIRVTEPGGRWPVGSTIVMMKSGFGRVFGPNGQSIGTIQPDGYVPGNAG